MLRTFFDVEVHHPELVFLQMVNPYLIGYDHTLSRLTAFIESVDDALYTLFPPLRPYSYRQVIELR